MSDMTRDDIIRLAREIASQCCNRTPSWTNDYAMSRIMELIDASAAAERKALREGRRRDMAEICSLRESEESLREENERLREALLRIKETKVFLGAIAQEMMETALRREEKV